MRAFAAVMLTPNEIAFTFHSPENINDIPFSMQKRRNVYLIFKEAVSNIVKYAGSTVVNIDVTIHENIFCMLITDNGKGFNQQSMEVYNGNGIKNMRARANDMGAEFSIQSGITEGTSIKVTLKM